MLYAVVLDGEVARLTPHLADAIRFADEHVGPGAVVFLLDGHAVHTVPIPKEQAQREGN